MSEEGKQRDPRMQDRAVETRRRLLDAAYQCLAEKGYAATTTQEVCRKIGVSRGTLLHHFATREELVSAAVEHVLEKTIASFRESLVPGAGESPSLAALTRSLWERHWTSGPFYAWLEMVVASRTDPALNEKVRAMEKRWMEKFAGAYRQVMGRDLDGLSWLFFLVMNALSIETIRSEPARVMQSLGDLVRLVETAERLLAPFPAPASPNPPKNEGKPE